MFVPIFIPAAHEHYYHDSYDDTALREKIEELEDTISQCTGVESEATRNRRLRHEREMEEYEATLKLEEMQKETKDFIFYGDLAEEYEYPYSSGAYDKCFSVYHHLIKYQEGSYRYHYLDDLKHSYEDEPKWITYKTFAITKKKWKFFDAGTGYRIVRITAPKIALDAITKDYEKEYLPKLEEIKKKHPIDLGQEIKYN